MDIKVMEDKFYIAIITIGDNDVHTRLVKAENKIEAETLVRNEYIETEGVKTHIGVIITNTIGQD